MAVDLLNEIPADDIFVIPALTEECEMPEELRPYQAVRLYQTGGLDMLIGSLTYKLRGA